MITKGFFRAVLLTLVGAVVLVAAGCSMDGGFAPSTSNSSFESQALVFVDADGNVHDQYTAVLYAGQTIEAGTVSVAADDDDLIFTYNTQDGWEITEVHLAFGTSYTDIPQNRQGNPMIGHFPYSGSYPEGPSTVEIRVPLSDFGGEEALYGARLYVAAHAVVQKQLSDGSFQSETGWGAGERMTKRGSWATFFSFVLEEKEGEDDDDVTLGSETAWAYGGSLATPFNTLLVGGNWGWTNGPLSAGSYEFAIYAGAGQNDLDKGTLVGTLSVDYDGATALVTYVMYEGFFMTETHLYVGNNQTPGTAAPGQLGNIRSGLDKVTSDSYTITGLSGDIYVMAHAVVLGHY
jgi:hypothetical protein